jgi:two-component system response regulator ChvI
MTASGRLVVLCVDDDPDILEQLRLLLEPRGHRVVTVSSAAGCRGCFDDVCPDLVLIDLMMETVDAGLVLARDLRARCSHARLYLLSSMGDGLTGQIDPTEAGFDGVFQKPLKPELLLSTLELIAPR